MVLVALLVAGRQSGTNHNKLVTEKLQSTFHTLIKGDIRLCSVATADYFSNVVLWRKQSCLEVISNPTVCGAYVFQTTVFGEIKLFEVLWFLV